MKRLIKILCLVCVLALLPVTSLADTQFLIDSDTRKITEEELWKWDRESLSFMFNEIFARHGFTFEPGGKFYNWFNSQPWYQGIDKVSDQTAYNLTSNLEWDNYYTIKKVITQMEAVNHPYRKSSATPGLKSWTDLTPPGKWSLTGFQYITLKGNQRLDVYSAPSTASWRGANGKAMVNTQGAVWAAGWENGWLQVFYETNNGAVRVGYVDGSKISGKVDFQQALFFSWTSVKLAASCTLTDDPLTGSSSITSLQNDASVAYLTTVVNQRGQVWDYIETSVNGKTVRGYIPSGVANMPADELPDLDEYAK